MHRIHPVHLDSSHGMVELPIQYRKASISVIISMSPQCNRTGRPHLEALGSSWSSRHVCYCYCSSGELAAGSGSCELTSEELQTRKHEGRQKSAVGQPAWKSAAILVAHRKEGNPETREQGFNID